AQMINPSRPQPPEDEDRFLSDVVKSLAPDNDPLGLDAAKQPARLSPATLRKLVLCVELLGGDAVAQVLDEVEEEKPTPLLMRAFLKQATPAQLRRAIVLGVLRL